MDFILFGLLAFACMGIACAPWIWIVVRRGTNVSNWDTRPVDSSWVHRVATGFSGSFEAHLKGRTVWVWIMFTAVLLFYFAILVQLRGHHWLEVLMSYLCCWSTGWAAVAFAWLRVGRTHNVHLGLLANFFIHGGVLGTTFALVLNTMLIKAWSGLSPDCHPQNIRMSIDCNTQAALMWVFTAGLVEETFKSVWLFFRLRRGQEDVPGHCCFCLPASQAWDCGCWFKLAPTPYHVFLCSLASAAGFESLENLIYVFLHNDVLSSIDDEQVRRMMLGTGIARMYTSGIHMVWTGLIGLGLARRLFLPKASRPSLLAVLMPSMLAHGLFDYSISAMNSAVGPVDRDNLDPDNPPNVQNPALVGLFLILALAAISTSIGLLGRRTGCRCLTGTWSFCCAPGFWEAAFGDFGQAREGPAVQLHENTVIAVI